ncbi:MAG: bifunctional phosphopantothenoylcysteine decarboxylase/phosphopantothenate--cysteine ligase CoaBC [Deltaproteobacteria bacterium]|nr:bifunctional phosphopantothenoylcysteine decarboxylase/phosphopantothenate--cysteine ligase CoaBC [Deltaproteobacteria bacterium]
MKEKKIIVGVSGGIAAYKAAELVRRLMKAGAHTQVAMTAAATRFVSPLPSEALSGHRVVHEMFSPGTRSMDHITWGQETDLVIVAPATADIIGKMANGIADDFLSTCLIAATAPILVCPSMNSQMFLNPAVQENLDRLEKRGLHVMTPDEGDLACGTEGRGRLPDPEKIVEQAAFILSEKDLEGLKILVTAGPTIEPIDPVRFITNRSSGKMGHALARAATIRGAEVVLVSGPTALPRPSGVTVIPIRTAQEMRDAVFENRSGCDIIIKAAAVSDYRPHQPAYQKIKKTAEQVSLNLVKTPDILAELGEQKGGSGLILVGFAAETEDLLANATQKLQSKHLDMIVANDVSQDDAGFGTDTNRAKLIFRDGSVEETYLMTKEEVAHLILDRAVGLRKA